MEVPKQLCEKCRPLFEKLLNRIEKLESEVKDLRTRLAFYENPNTPPSQRRFPKKRDKPTSGRIGAPKGHKGATRETKKPDEVIELKEHKCKHCHNLLSKPFKQERRVTEEIPEPQPVKVTEYKINHYKCKSCGKITIAEHNDLPKKGIFGKNALSHITLMKFEDRLPIRKVVKSLRRQHNLHLTHTSVFNITERVSNKLREKYKKVIAKIRKSSYVHIDQTDLKVNRLTYDLWVFVTDKSTLFIIRKGKRNNVMEEVLGEKYDGIIIGDGLSTYRKYTDKLQRCWAHLLREAKFLAEKYEGQARKVYEELQELYKEVKHVTYEDPPPYRKNLYEKFVSQMQMLVNRIHAYKKLRKFATKIKNGLKHWFTRVLYPFIEATNNRAERALRELIVQRKIIGTLRNTKGTKIVETIMTMITTWQQRGLNTFSQLKASL